MKKFTLAIITATLLALSLTCAYAGEFLPSFAQLIRTNTGAEISVALASDEAAAQSGTNDKITLRKVSGEYLYGKISALIALSGNEYPCLSGADLSLEASSTSGVRSEKLTAMTIGGKDVDLDKSYTVALSANADTYFEECEKTAVYTADVTQLYNSIVSIAPYNEGEAQDTASQAPDTVNGESEGQSIISRQNDILMLTLTLLMLALVAYLYLRMKKNKESADKK